MSNSCVCPLCAFEFPKGVVVCRGCGGDVIYGARKSERSDGAKVGAGIGFVAGIIGLMLIPAKLGVQPAFGLKLEGCIMLVGAAMLIGSIIGGSLATKRHAGSIRVFRRASTR